MTCALILSDSQTEYAGFYLPGGLGRCYSCLYQEAYYYRTNGPMIGTSCCDNDQLNHAYEKPMPALPTWNRNQAKVCCLYVQELATQ